jgi:hypothetical protein
VNRQKFVALSAKQKKLTAIRVLDHHATAAITFSCGQPFSTLKPA